MILYRLQNFKKSQPVKTHTHSRQECVQRVARLMKINRELNEASGSKAYQGSCLKLESG